VSGDHDTFHFQGIPEQAACGMAGPAIALESTAPHAHRSSRSPAIGGLDDICGNMGIVGSAVAIGRLATTIV
jgi:hypothetical protein